VVAAPNVRIIDQNICFATWDRVLIQIWRGVATAEAPQQLLELGKVFLTENAGHPCSSLSIIESPSPPPGEKVRKLLATCYRELAPGLRHQIIVAEGSGFRSALVRGVGLTVSTFAPSLLPFNFVASMDEAALTISDALSSNAGGADALKAAVTSLRVFDYPNMT
jgi:hypothetical protein